MNPAFFQTEGIYLRVTFGYTVTFLHIPVHLAHFAKAGDHHARKISNWIKKNFILYLNMWSGRRKSCHPHSRTRPWTLLVPFCRWNERVFRYFIYFKSITFKNTVHHFALVAHNFLSLFLLLRIFSLSSRISVHLICFLFHSSATVRKQMWKKYLSVNQEREKYYCICAIFAVLFSFMFLYSGMLFHLYYINTQ